MLLKPQRRKEVVSQIDVLPTIAGMVHQPYINTTLGRDVLDPDKKNNYAFITNAAGKIGVVTDQYYFTANLNPDFPDDQMVPIVSTRLPYTAAQQDSIRQRLSSFAFAFFETARYMLMNNKKD